MKRAAAAARASLAEGRNVGGGGVQGRESGVWRKGLLSFGFLAYVKSTN